MAVGRFLGEDPIGFNGGTNFYLYVGNHSPDFIDPQGLVQLCCRPANLSLVELYAKLTLQPPPCHCFVRLSNGDTLGGYHSYFGLGVGNFGMLITDKNNKSDSDNNYPRVTNCYPVIGQSCVNDARAKKAFDALPKVIGEYGTGPGLAGTSNAVAATILKNPPLYPPLPPSPSSQSPNPPPNTFLDN